MVLVALLLPRCLSFFKKNPVPWKIIGGIGLTLGVLKFTLMFGGIYMGMSAGFWPLLFCRASVFHAGAFCNFL